MLPHSFAIVDYHSKDFCKTKCIYPELSHIFLAFTLIGQYYLQNDRIDYEKYYKWAIQCSKNARYPLKEDMYWMHRDIYWEIEKKFDFVMWILQEYYSFYKVSYGVSTCPVVVRIHLNKDDILFRGWRNLVLSKKCNYCFNKSTKLLKCHGICQGTGYCSRICQKRDWINHKISCRKQH